MGSVGAPVIRRIVQVADGPEPPEVLLAGVGLSPDVDPASWASELVDEDAYYDLLERVGGDRDPGLPLRYGQALVVDDVGALGLALKTAPTLGDSLGRLIRYILVLSDTLTYEWVDESGGRVFALTGRPAHRTGAALANECALAAVTSTLRQAAGTPDLAPRAVSFRHEAPSVDGHHLDYFGCPVHFGAEVDGIHLSAEDLARATLLADAGLSAYLLAQLDDLRSQRSDRSLVAAVRGAVADALADGQPSKSQIARRLGMSERTLHRRLAEEGASFQDLVTATRREAAESLLGSDRHSLAEVAFLSGFSDQTAFTRAFKRWTGQTPAAFREATA